MNNWHTEFMAEYQRQRIRREMQRIRLEEEAGRAPIYRPGWMAYRMYDLANWMIATGKQLRRRYEIPAAQCPPASNRSFAR
ncbi:MAG: hypothetical protein ACOYZ8_00690 [Chloroflexota bacterium]